MVLSWVRIASRYTGIEVADVFSNLDEKEAMMESGHISSILHLSYGELEDAFKNGSVHLNHCWNLYTSFKYGIWDRG